MASKGQKEEERCRGTLGEVCTQRYGPFSYNCPAVSVNTHLAAQTEEEAPNNNTSPTQTRQTLSALLGMRPRGAAAV